MWSTRDFKPAGSMLRNLFGSHVLSDLLLLGAQSIQIKTRQSDMAGPPLHKTMLKNSTMLTINASHPKHFLLKFLVKVFDAFEICLD